MDNVQKGEEFVEYIPGDVSLILSIPHGGWVDDPSIPDRGEVAAANLINNNVKDAPKIRITTDGYTIDLGIIVYDTIVERLGRRPHLVICHLKRSKVDVNRDIVEGALENPVARATHKAYHSAIRRSKTGARRGIVFDIHGQSHMQNSTELGYLISKEALNSCQADTEMSSIRRLGQEVDATGPELIIGKRSLGAMLEEEGYRAVPSPRQPSPGSDKYYAGGFITKCHGSKFSCGSDPTTTSPIFDAIQLETPREARIDAGVEGLKRFGIAIGNALSRFYENYYM